MIELFNQKKIILRQIQRDLRDIKQLASNLTLRAEGSAWQVLLKYQILDRSFPEGAGFCLGIFDAFAKDPFFVELSEQEARQKLKAWGHSSAEIDNLVNFKLEDK